MKEVEVAVVALLEVIAGAVAVAAVVVEAVRLEGAAVVATIAVVVEVDSIAVVVDHLAAAVAQLVQCTTFVTFKTYITESLSSIVSSAPDPSTLTLASRMKRRTR